MTTTDAPSATPPPGTVCDCCQSEPATVHDGTVDLCTACAVSLSVAMS